MRNVLKIDQERLAVQEVLDSRKTQAERNQLGQFATPPGLALEMAQLAKALYPQRGKIRFLDPAIGTGAFFAALQKVFSSDRIASARGIEIDEGLASEARRLWSRLGLRVTTGDFTRTETDLERATLLITNPPYVRHHHMEQDDKLRLQKAAVQATGVEVNGLTGLYVYFLLLAHEWLAPDGLALWLIPSEFMDVNYGVSVKSYLCERVTLLRIHRFNPQEVQFGDALVSSAVVVFRKTPPLRGQAATLTYGGSLLKPEREETVPVAELRQSRKWTRYPRVGEGTLGPADQVQLGELFRIRRGIATGANEFFILPRSEAQRLELPNEFLKPILPSPRMMPEVIIQDAGDGYPALSSPLALLDCPLPEEQVRRKYPSLWRYFGTASEELRQRYLIRTREPWYRQEQRLAPPFLCTYMGRGLGDENPFRFVWNQSAAIATNVYLMLYPIGALATALKQGPQLAHTVHTLLQTMKPDDLRNEGRVYGGGLHKIEPKELARVSAERFLKKIPSLRGALFRQLDLALPARAVE